MGSSASVSRPQTREEEERGNPTDDIRGENSSDSEDDDSLAEGDSQSPSKKTSTSLDTWEKIESVTCSHFEQIQKCEVKTESVKKQIGKLNNIYKKLSRRQNEDVVQYASLLAKLGLVPTLIKFMSTPRDDYFESMFFSNLNPLFTLVWNTSDLSKDICSEVLKHNLQKFIIEDLQKPVLKVENLKSEDGTQQMKPIRVVKALFAILYNTLRNIPSCKQAFREEGLIDVTLTFLNTTILSIKAKALLTLTFAADLEVNREIIQATGSNIGFILNKMLETAISSPRHRSPKYGYTVEELMEGFSLLSKNSSNAVQMVDLGILDRCATCLQQEFSEAEVKWTLTCIWSLTFVDELREKITACEGIMNKVEHFKSHKSREIAEAANGILWQLKVAESKGAEVMPQNESGRHIMISYNWTHQVLALKIFEKLKNAGKTVWMDVEKMHGDSIGKMADAVENSTHIVCCFSEEYSNSQACRSEATYAYKKKKEIVFAKMQPTFEPSGWLGFILGANIYYHMYDDIQIEKEFQKLLAYIEQMDVVDSNQDVIAPSTVAITNTTPKPVQKQVKSVQFDSIYKWTTADVKKWFESIGCSPSNQTSSLFDQIDGKLLTELKIWQVESPEFFLKFSEEKLGLDDPVNLMKFSNSLRFLSD